MESRGLDTRVSSLLELEPRFGGAFFVPGPASNVTISLPQFMKSQCMAILRMASLKIPHRSKRGVRGVSNRVNDASSDQPARILNAQGEQRDCAHTREQNHQCHRVVVEPMPAL